MKIYEFEVTKDRSFLSKKAEELAKKYKNSDFLTTTEEKIVYESYRFNSFFKKEEEKSYLVCKHCILTLNMNGNIYKKVNSRFYNFKNDKKRLYQIIDLLYFLNSHSSYYRVNNSQKKNKEIEKAKKIVYAFIEKNYPFFDYFYKKYLNLEAIRDEENHRCCCYEEAKLLRYARLLEYGKTRNLKKFDKAPKSIKRACFSKEDLLYSIQYYIKLLYAGFKDYNVLSKFLEKKLFLLLL